MKKGNIDFDLKWVSDVSWPDFEAEFKGKLQGYDIRKAYKELTGRDPVSPKPKKDGKTVKSDKKPGKPKA